MGAEICGGGSNGFCGNWLSVEFAFGNARMRDSLVAVGGRLQTDFPQCG